MSRLWILGIAILATGVLAACGSNDDETNGDTAGSVEPAPEVEFTGSIEEEAEECYPEPGMNDLRIGWASPLEANETIVAQTMGIESETERLGGELLTIDAQGDPDAQVSALGQMIAQEVDAIIVFPLDPSGLVPVLEDAQDAGIPVVAIEATYDSTDPGPGIDTQVWQRRDYMSYLQAQAAASAMGPGATFAQIAFAVPVPTIEFAVERAAYWAEQYGLEPGIQTDNPTDDIAGGEQAMTEILTQASDIDGLIAYNDASAVGAAAAARGQGVPDMPIIGNNATSLGRDAVETGRIYATVQLPGPEVGICAARGAYNLVEGQDVPEAVIGGEPQLITQDTIDETPTWDEFLEEEFGTAG